MEAHQNVQAYSALDLLRWHNGSEGPDYREVDLFVTGLLTDYASKALAIHGMEITTFQFVYLPADGLPPSNYALYPRFQSSQDGVHWDDLPSTSFSVDLSTLEIGPSIPTVTIEVLCNSNYIRCLLNPVDIEVQSINNGDLLKVYVTTKEG